MRQAPLGPGFFVGDFDQFIRDQTQGAQRDGAVGRVEGGEVPRLPVKVQKIDDIPQTQSVDHIANGASHDHGQCE